jgi:peptidoglycan/LPS O-acetylase OafA/YrhL
MGVFRIILALSVFAAHAYEAFSGGVPLDDWKSLVSRNGLHIFIWSGHAVFAFFILSGFYMAMVICQKYSKLTDGTRRFYFNRALRLYPTNWVILVAYILFYIASHTPSFLTFHGGPRPWLTPLAFFCNFFFLGTEIIPFGAKTNWYYVIGPIWSLSIEAYFYLLAPFIVRRSLGFIFCLATISAALRLTLCHFGIATVPWRYFFFPSDLVFFLMGVLAYRLYEHVKKSPWTKPAGIAASCLLLGLIVCKPFWNTAGNLDRWQSWAFFLAVALCAPFLFSLTKDNRIDNFVGQLSYPVYLGHMLVFAVLMRLSSGQIDKPILSLVLTLLLATTLYLAVDRPIEKIRQRIPITGAKSRPRLRLPALLRSRLS